MAGHLEFARHDCVRFGGPAGPGAPTRCHSCGDPRRRLFAATLFFSALLLFAVQPMFTKMVLPRLGGSPSVWSVAMVAFQAFLFIGYVYAHVLTRTLSPRCAALVHLGFLALVASSLPLGIAEPSTCHPPTAVMIWLVGLFAASIGLPFIALSATAPLLQSWFVATGHPQARNPYVLYAASNLGSFCALLAYPFVLEPFLSLHTQAHGGRRASQCSPSAFALTALMAVRPPRNCSPHRLSKRLNHRFAGACPSGQPGPCSWECRRVCVLR